MITPETAARIYADSFVMGIWEAFVSSKEREQRQMFREGLKAAYKAGMEHNRKEDTGYERINTTRLVRVNATAPEVCIHNMLLGSKTFCPKCPSVSSP